MTNSKLSLSVCVCVCVCVCVYHSTKVLLSSLHCTVEVYSLVIMLHELVPLFLSSFVPLIS